jgi:hypothetical protein
MTRCNCESTSQATTFSRTLTTGVGFEAMLLRRGRMNGQHRGGGKG